MKKIAVFLLMGIAILAPAVVTGFTVPVPDPVVTDTKITVPPPSTPQVPPDKPVPETVDDKPDKEPSKTAYVPPANINQLHVEQITPQYTYSFMKEDLEELSEMYPDLISTDVVGKSVLGREIIGVKLGKGPEKLFVNGAHHGREWLTAVLNVKMIYEYCKTYTDDKTIGGFNVRQLLDQNSIYFVPMVNPDGVQISQFSSYYWKANGRGVDLYDNYPGEWIDNPKITRPGAVDYRGDYPASEPETQALMELTRSKRFMYAISYHSSGEVVYWDSKNYTTSVRDKARMLLEKFKAAAGYEEMPDPNSKTEIEASDGSSYRDWYINTFNQPSFTIEIGKKKYIGKQIPMTQLKSIWEQNKSIPLILLATP